MRFLAASAILVAAVNVYAQSPNPEMSRLLKARTLRCSFSQGSNVKWESGKPEIRESNFGADLIFDSINRKKGTAKLIGNQGASMVTVSASTSGLTFTETTGSGSVMITTVFSRYAKDTNDFIVVHSRHFTGLIGDPLPSQYHGTCKVIE